ncbi:MAG: hypothetical protein DRI26_00170 [Chloroflexi bacterium]|nr:MAG: hypothetical protein DRI26_00170 [Chloroflexota bacterium]
MEIRIPRKVQDHKDVSDPEDFNSRVDNWKYQASLNQDIYARLQEALGYSDPDLESLIAQLKNIVSQMRYFKKGDYYYARDHNLFVDAWNIQKQIDDIFTQQVAPRLGECFAWNVTVKTEYVYEDMKPYIHEEVICEVTS